MRYIIPVIIRTVIKKLNDNGFEAFIVGGAARNLYLDLPVNDWDITSDALPEEVEKLFAKSIPTGKRFGTITVVENGMNIEITTYRRELGYSDNRKPDGVIYTKVLKEDLLRRDFTMNAMTIDGSGNLFDHLGGIESIESRQLVCVGDAEERFKEDYLRILRYVRFTTQLGFKRNPEIDNVILNLEFSKTLSVERIREEFNKILLSKIPSKGIVHLKDLNLLDKIIPSISKCYEFDQKSKFHHLDVFNHTMVVLDNIPPTIQLRLSALLHDIGKPDTFELIDGEGHFYKHDKISAKIAEDFLTDMKYSNIIKREVLTLVLNHMRLLDVSNKKSVKKFMNKIGIELLEDFLHLRKADILGCKTNDELSSVEKMRESFKAILSENEPMSVKDLALNGYDLMNYGYEGKEIGAILNMLLEYILENPNKNEKNILFKVLADFKKNKI